MLILRGSILASMVPRFTSLHAVACQDLHPWNPSSTLTPKTLHQESWKFNWAMDSVTQLFWTRTANSLVFAAKPLTSCTSTAMFYQATTIIQWFLSKLIDISWRAWRSWPMSATLSVLPLRRSFSCIMRGTHAQFQAQTSHVASLLSVVNLPSQLITPQTGIGNWRFLLQVWNPNQETLPLAFLRFVKSPNSLSKSTEPITMSSSTHVAQIHTRILSETLCLPTVLLNWMLRKAVSISWPMHSLDPGISPQSSKLSWVCRMSALPILTRHWCVGRHVGNMSENVGPTFGDICHFCPFLAPSMLCCFRELPTFWHVHT